MSPIDIKCMIETIQETSSIDKLGECIDQIARGAAEANVSVTTYIRNAVTYCDQILCIPEELQSKVLV